MSHPRIDEFYLDKDMGYMKFSGYEDGHYLFHAYTKLNLEKRWKEDRHAYKLHPSAFDAKRARGLLTPSVPPI